MGRILFVLTVVCMWVSSEALFGLDGHGKPLNLNRQIPPVTQIDPRLLEFKIMEMRRNNFNVLDHERFYIRYVENKDYFVEGGPIFILLSGRESLDPNWLAGGLMYDIAREMNGSMYSVEHRYYGRSAPTEDSSTYNLRFQNVDQILVDLAVFITNIKASIPSAENSPVFLVGKAFGASLATWFRVQYPHLVQGVWSSSAPLNAQFDFAEFMEVVGTSIRKVGTDVCYNRLEQAFDKIVNLIESGQTSQLDSLFKLCTPIDITSPMDINSFMVLLSEIVGIVVQHHRRVEIHGMCFFLNVMYDSLDAFSHFVRSLMLGNTEEACLMHSYANIIEAFKMTEWPEYYDNNIRIWAYQMCMEIGLFQTSTSNDQPLGSAFPTEGFEEFCEDVYGEIFTPELALANNNRHNRVFGGRNPAVSNVLLTYGEFDPYRAMGPNKDLNEWSPVLIIPDAGHISDVYSIRDDDLPGVLAAKKTIKETFYEWQSQFRNRTSN